MVYSSLPIGSEIEVRSNEEGFKGAWFEAKVVSYIPRSRKYTVLFSNFVSEENPSKPLEDSVYHTFVRPRPPPSDAKARFTKYDLVEALHNDGWWKGVVNGTPRGKGLVYRVFFPSTSEELECRREDIREQLEWVKGEWVRVQDMEDKSGKRKFLVKGPTIPISALPSSMDNSEVTVKRSVMVKVDGGIETFLPSKKLKKELPPVDHLKLTDITKLIGHRRQSQRIKSFIHCRRKRFLSGRRSKVHTQVQNSKNSNGEAANAFGIVNCGSETTSTIGKSTSVGPLIKGSPTLLVEQHHSTSSAQLKVGTKSAEVCHEQDMSRVNGNDSINHAERSCFLGDASQPLSKTSNFGHLSVGDEAADFLPIADLGNYKACRGLTKNTEMQKLSLDHKRNTFDIADVKQHAVERKNHKLGKPRKKKRSYINVNVNQCPKEAGKKNRVGRPPKKKIIYIKGSEKEHATEDRKRHRDRPKKFKNINGTKSKQFVEPTDQTLTVDAYEKARECKNSMLAVNAEGTAAANAVTNTCLYDMQADIMEDFPITCEVDLFVQDPKSPYHSDIQQSLLLICGNNNVAEAEAEAHTNVSKNAVEMENATIDPTPVACDQNQKVYGEIEDRASIDPSPSGSSLSKGFNSFDHKEHTPNRPLSEKTVIRSKKAASDQDELRPSTLPSPDRVLIDNMHISSLSNETALHFTKESTMWRTVESMEAFHTMPQQPHFHPLVQYEVEFREGMAIGLMVTFANLVASIKKLCITDSQDIFEEKLKALTPLELNGFNIQPVRSRLEKLNEIRNGAGQAQSKKAYLKERIMEREEEKEELDMLISAHDKLILELEENLSHCRKKKTSMVCGSNKKDSEIIQLKIDLQATEEAFFSAEEHFNASADAPWNVT